MRVFSFIKQGILQSKYARFFSIFATIFALIYHFSFLIVFRLLGVMPMFYFNFFSVFLFSLLTVIVIKKDSFVIPFHFFYSEVVIHQILADFFLGGNSAFHFFILLSGILPLLTFKKQIKLASFYGLLSVSIFIGFEVFATHIPSRYDISEIALLIIRAVNVLLTSIVNIIALLVYSFALWLREYSLEATVQRQKIEAAEQDKKMLMIQNNIINSLANLVENRDTDTGEHIKRTSAYVELIARSCMDMNIYTDIIDENFVILLKRAAPLHDIGKILVSDAVLKKPGKLTSEEFELIKVHCKEGGRIINDVVGNTEDENFIKMASDVATYHHERWDGKGYPYNLNGENIPVSARIMALADVFDALISPRCYKKEFTQEEAIKIIREEAGTHFDPVLTELFISMQDKVSAVLKVLSVG